MTSANLTWTARGAARHTNYGWYVDLAEGDPWLERVRRDYDARQDHVPSLRALLTDRESPAAAAQH
jgi:hypothetical protein